MFLNTVCVDPKTGIIYFTTSSQVRGRVSTEQQRKRGGVVDWLMLRPSLTNTCSCCGCCSFFSFSFFFLSCYHVNTNAPSHCICSGGLVPTSVFWSLRASPMAASTPTIFPPRFVFRGCHRVLRRLKWVKRGGRRRGRMGLGKAVVKCGEGWETLLHTHTGCFGRRYTTLSWPPGHNPSHRRDWHGQRGPIPS